MSVAENKAVASKFFDALSTGDLQTSADLMAEDHIFHFPLFGEPVDKAGHAAGQVKVLEAIPDFNEEVLGQFGEGDMVFSRLRLRGTRKGEFMGVPAANQKIDIEIFNVMKMRDGKIVEEWDEFDTISFLVQLGVIEQPQIGNVETKT